MEFSCDFKGWSKAESEWRIYAKQLFGAVLFYYQMDPHD